GACPRRAQRVDVAPRERVLDLARPCGGVDVAATGHREAAEQPGGRPRFLTARDLALDERAQVRDAGARDPGAVVPGGANARVHAIGADHEVARDAPLPGGRPDLDRPLAVAA